jgi:hypothetical protein
VDDIQLRRAIQFAEASAHRKADVNLQIIVMWSRIIEYFEITSELVGLI